MRRKGARSQSQVSKWQSCTVSAYFPAPHYSCSHEALQLPPTDTCSPSPWPSSSHLATTQKQPEPGEVFQSIPLPLAHCSGASVWLVSGAHLAMVQERVTVAKSGESRVSAAAASF